MPLTQCACCGKPRSDLAIVCPHCGDGADQARKLAEAPCRTCGAALERARHLTQVNGVFQHRPCHACGEPYPIAIPSSAVPMSPRLKRALVEGSLEGFAPLIVCVIFVLVLFGPRAAMNVLFYLLSLLFSWLP
ncbi:MAG TPA: hypothetical protein VFJ82_05560 [Longimicrobium sp.]|nr:hypothetical protein [Longimicrobium sp.]